MRALCAIIMLTTALAAQPTHSVTLSSDQRVVASGYAAWCIQIEGEPGAVVHIKIRGASITKTTVTVMLDDTGGGYAIYNVPASASGRLIATASNCSGPVRTRAVQP